MLINIITQKRGESRLKRKADSGIILIILLAALICIPLVDKAMAYAAIWAGGPSTLYRGGTFGYLMGIQTYSESETLSYNYWLEAPFEPLLVSWDPPPPAAVPPGTNWYKIFFNLTIPADAPLGHFRIWWNVHVPGDWCAGYWYVDITDLSANIDFEPPHIVFGEGDWIYCHIEPPEPASIYLGYTRSGKQFKEIDFGPSDIDVSTVWLNNTVPAEPSIADVGDFDGDGVLDLKIAFDKSDVDSFILGQGITSGNVTLEVTGQFLDGWAFAGSSRVEVFAVVNATVDIVPNTLNLRAKPKYVNAFIELPEGYNVSEIDLSSILMNDTIAIDPSAPTLIGDYNNDGIPDLMVKFNGTEVIAYVLANVNMTQLSEERSMTITLTINGHLNGETLFKGCDTVRIILPGGKGAGKRTTTR